VPGLPAARRDATDRRGIHLVLLRSVVVAAAITGSAPAPSLALRPGPARQPPDAWIRQALDSLPAARIGLIPTARPA
jgi:hypothetical protein